MLRMGGVPMNATAIQKQTEVGPLLVPAKAIARDLSCTPRFVLMLLEQGKIPGVRFGRACIRFNRAAVFEALGVQTEAAAVAGVDQ
jgi:excisionase family DNA binding protein